MFDVVTAEPHTGSDSDLSSRLDRQPAWSRVVRFLAGARYLRALVRLFAPDTCPQIGGFFLLDGKSLSTPAFSRWFIPVHFAFISNLATAKYLNATGALVLHGDPGRI